MTIKSKYQGKTRVDTKGRQTEATYYIVNPSGAVHSCTRAHAKWRLKDKSYRTAEDGEIEQFLEARTQTFQNPIAPPQKLEEIFIPEIPDAEYQDEVEATQAARELASESNVDLKKVTPTGANERVLVGDVREYLEG